MKLITHKQVEDKVITIRDQKVLIDSDVAQLYGVETREITQAVKNNPDKFPNGYIIFFDNNEWADLKSKFLISSWGGNRNVPKVFTEKGLYMLATILKSPKAAATTIAIVETFAKIRELTKTISQLSASPDKENQKSLMQKGGEIIAEILDNDLSLSETETSFEINFALMKFKHTIKKNKKHGK